jgi:hypothetical protein
VATGVDEIVEVLVDEPVGTDLGPNLVFGAALFSALCAAVMLARRSTKEPTA